MNNGNLNGAAAPGPNAVPPQQNAVPPQQANLAPVAANNAVDKIDFPFFDDTANGANPGEFLRRWEDLRRRYGWTEATLMSYVSGGLRGEARHWWDEILGAQRHRPNAKKSWAPFCDAFRERFAQTKHSYDMVDLMSRLRQQKNSTIKYGDNAYFIMTQIDNFGENRMTETAVREAIANADSNAEAFRRGYRECTADIVFMLFKAGVRDELRAKAWNSTAPHIGDLIQELSKLEIAMKKPSPSEWNGGKVAAINFCGNDGDSSDDASVEAVGTAAAAAKKKSDFFKKKKAEKSIKKSSAGSYKSSSSGASRDGLYCEYCTKTNHRISDCFLKKKADANRNGGNKSNSGRAATISSLYSGNE
jgi:hypothetical protein